MPNTPQSNDAHSLPTASLSTVPAGSSAVVSVAAAVAVASPGPVHEAPQPRRPRRGQRSDVGTLRLRRPRIRREHKPSIVDDLAWGRCVGAGTFGRVSFATHLPTGTPCAVKTLRKSEILRTGQLDHVRSEKAVLEAIDHPLIVRLLGAAQDTDCIHLVMEFAGGGEMFGHLRREGRFSESRARFYASEIACAISHLHRRGVAYRDLKPENGKSLF